MSDPVKIASLELENVKRVKAVELSPAADGLTVIGGRNAQGKTSVLDAIAWALGGNRKRPGRPNREGAATPARLHVELSNGLVVERSGKNGSLKVTDPTGRKGTQAVLDGFIEELALDLPKFMVMNDKGKAEELLRIIGVGDELARLDRESKGRYDRRTEVSRQERTKRNSAAQMPYHADAPAEPVSASELVREQSDILARNGENRRKRERAAQIGAELERANADVADLEGRLAEARVRAAALADDYMTASKTAEQLEDESTAEVEAKLAEIDELNEKVRANQRKADAEADADALKEEADGLTSEIEALRRERTSLLAGADMPLDGLTVDEDGRLVYRGSTWGDMSAAEQLRVATAVVRSLKPECGFVLVDRLEQMDPVQLAEFGSWAEGEGLQVIGTRVATDGTCTVLIEDGRVVGPGAAPADADAPSMGAADAAQPVEKKPEALKHERPVFIPGAF